MRFFAFDSIIESFVLLKTKNDACIFYITVLYLN